MKHSSKLIILLFFCMCFTFTTHAANTVSGVNGNQDLFEILMQKIRADRSYTPKMADLKQDLKRFDTKTGAFTDIDYTKNSLTNWVPFEHLEKLKNAVYAYTMPGNLYYADSKLFDVIVKGLDYWYQRNPICRNWWYNQVAVPQELCALLIQMRLGKMKVPVELETKILKRLSNKGGDPALKTGANRTDIALHWISRSCLTRNEETLQYALNQVFDPIRYTTKEGFQYDNSYFQHGTQLYIGGYGDEILKGITQVAMYVVGTKFALSDEKVEFLSKFMRETYYNTFRGKYMSFDVMGRSMSRKGRLDKTSTLTFAKRMLTLDPKHKEDFEAIIGRITGKKPVSYAVNPVHTHYFNGDYTLHVRPSYLFDVRLNSNRTCRLEYGNNENLKTYFISDGCTNIVTEGNEYFNIMPTWNWSRLPGISCPQVDNIPLAKSAWQQMGTSTFAGGVSDSLYGATGYAYTDTWKGMNMDAHKSWFFFENEVVCLGNVSSTSNFEINTTINQCLLHHNEVYVSHEKKVSLVDNGQYEWNNASWVLHNHVGYVFPKGGSVYLTKQEQKGSWYAINRAQKKGQVTNEVLTLGFTHGKNPKHASYAYIVVPAVEKVSNLKKYVKRESIKIVANTYQIQSVCNDDLGIWQSVFFEGGKVGYKNLSITANKSCALMLKKLGKHNYELHVSDPTQRQEVITITIDLPDGKQQTIHADFTNTGVYAGATKQFML